MYWTIKVENVVIKIKEVNRIERNFFLGNMLQASICQNDRLDHSVKSNKIGRKQNISNRFQGLHISCYIC